MIITKKALPRRMFLRGVGATLALPLLDAMLPSMTALAASRPVIVDESDGPMDAFVTARGMGYRLATR